MQVPYNQIFKDQNGNLIPSSIKKAIVSSVNVTLRQANIYYINNPETVIQNVPLSNTVDATALTPGDKVKVDIFDETNPKDIVIAYSYGGSSNATRGTLVAGTNGQVIFNDNDQYAGDTGFIYDVATQTVKVVNLTNNTDLATNLSIASNFALDIRTTAATPGSSGNIVMATSDANTAGGFTETSGSITIETGSSFLNAGNITIQTGNSITNGTGGTISLFANSGSDGNPNGAISLSTIGTRDTSTTGTISLIVSDASGAGNLDGGTIVISPGAQANAGNPGQTYFQSGNIFFRTVQFAGGDGVIAIGDAATNPSTTPSGGGVLYSSAGALHWLGSSGTDTIIAPA